MQVDSKRRASNASGVVAKGAASGAGGGKGSGRIHGMKARPASPPLARGHTASRSVVAQTPPGDRIMDSLFDGFDASFSM
jgi:hypothetical protein